GQKDRHHRGPRAGRKTAPDAGGFPRGGRAAMRMVHARDDPRRGRAFAEEPASDGRRDRRGNEWPYLPLRGVFARGRGDSVGRKERRPGMRRRDFFAVLGGGILVLLVDDSDAQESGGGARRGTNQAAPEAISAWLHIGEDGRVTVFTGKVEVGQN